MFIGALFIIMKTLKQPKYCSLDEWMNKLSYIIQRNTTVVINFMCQPDCVMGYPDI